MILIGIGTIIFRLLWIRSEVLKGLIILLNMASKVEEFDPRKYMEMAISEVKNLNAPSFSRNPIIMFVFSQLKLVEQRRLGFKTINELPVKYGFPLPVIKKDGPYLEIAFPRNKNIEQLTDEELTGYEFIKECKRVNKKAYSEGLNYSTRQAERHLKKFTDLGLVQRKGASTATYYELNS